MTENKVDWTQYVNRRVHFIDPQRRDKGWQYDGQLTGVDTMGTDEVKFVLVNDKDGNQVFIPISLANIYILLDPVSQGRDRGELFFD